MVEAKGPWGRVTEAIQSPEGFEFVVQEGVEGRASRGCGRPEGLQVLTQEVSLHPLYRARREN